MDRTRTPIERYLDLMAKALICELNPENGARIEYLVNLATQGEDANARAALLKDLVGLHRENAKARDALADLYAPKNWWAMCLGFPFSMIGPQRLVNVRHAVETVIREGVRGDLVETGVWRGGACILMKAVLEAYGESRRVYVCDSFKGLPKVETGVDAALRLDDNPLLSVPLADVRSHFERFDLLDERVVFVEGWFKDTMPELAHKDPQQIAVLRLDGDYYSSTMEVLSNIYSKVTPGGFVIVDDFHTYEQCANAVNDFRRANGVSEEIIDIDGAGIYWRHG